jgi:hypothetical protein
MFFSGSMSATATCSSILWMVALGGPSSITWGQIWAMKRPSLVPPVVDSSVHAGFGADGGLHRVHQVARRGEEGQAAQRPVQVVVQPMAVQHGVHALLQAFGRGFGAEPEVEVDHHAPGMTLLAPVPPWMLLICQLVGGKKALPLVPLGGHQFGQRRRGLVDGVAGQLRVGDVALDALAR